MASADLSIAYRPPRIGFLVRRGSVDDVVAAARLNTLLWGGIRNPILPLDQDLDRSKKLVSDFSVDLLYPIADDDPGLRAVVEAFPFLDAPPEIKMHGLFKLVGEDEFGVADIRLPVSHYFETLVRLGGESSRASLPNWSGDDPLATLFAVVFGDYATKVPGPRYRRAFLALRADEVRIGEEVPVELLRRVTPLQFTSDRLTRRPRWPHGHGIVLGDPADADALAGFWNLRSIGMKVAFWPLPDGDRFKTYCLQHLKAVVPRPQDGGEVAGPELWRGAWPEEKQKIPPAIESLLAEVGARPVLGTIDDLTWSQPFHRPDVWSARPRSVLATVEDDRWGGRQIAIALPDHPYSAAEVDYLWFSHWIVDVSMASNYDTPGYTLQLPSLPELNIWASEVISPIGHVRLNSHAVGFFARPRDTSLRFRLPEELEVVRQVLLRAGMTATTSSAGQAVSRIIDQMGGLLSCRSFRLPGVRKLLARSPETDGWREALKIIEDEGSLGKYANIHGSSADVLRRLLEKGVLRAGLRLQCPACTIRSRYDPEEVATEVRCPRCGSSFLLAPTLKESKWEYQTSGFFAHHREHGAIPVILTMLRLEHDLSGRSHILIPSQRLVGGDLDCEADFIALHQWHDGEITLALGECKGGSEKITSEGFQKLVAAANRIRSSGLECYLVFATTRPTFEEDEIQVFRKYRDGIQGQRSLDEVMHGWPRPTPILFTWRELQSYEAYAGPLRQRLPEQHPMRLREFAANSAFVYLNEHEQALPPDDRDQLLI